MASTPSLGQGFHTKKAQVGWLFTLYQTWVSIAMADEWSSDSYIRNGQTHKITRSPNLTSAFSVSRTFWPLMSLWMTLWWWRWVRPCRRAVGEESWVERGYAEKDWGSGSCAYPEDLTADVGCPLLLQGVTLGVLDQVRHRSSTTKLHHQLHVKDDQSGLACRRNSQENDGTSTNKIQYMQADGRRPAVRWCMFNIHVALRFFEISKF